MPSTSDRAALVQSVFEQRYPEFQYRFIEFLTGHLLDVSREFRGDLQLPTILAIIGQVLIYSMQSGKAEEAAISASRIADVSGIPRQTVRRKLAELERLGWIEQTSDRSWRMCTDASGTPAQRDLQQLDRRAIGRVAKLYVELDRLVRPA